MTRAKFEKTQYTPDNLIAGSTDLVTQKVIIKSGQDLTYGAVLGKDGAGKCLLHDKDAADGSEVVQYILAESIDATGGDAEAIVYKTGEFFKDAISLGGSTTISDVEDALRALNIHLV